jgi:hypothetical protein
MVLQNIRHLSYNIQDLVINEESGNYDKFNNQIQISK